VVIAITKLTKVS